jgi:hypothetical protein
MNGNFGSQFSNNPNPGPQQQNNQSIPLNFHEPEFLRNFKIPDGVCLIGDYHFLRGDFIVLAGPPGVGKSRAAVAAAVCGASQSPWFGYTVHQKFKTMIFQNENGIIRLHLEIDEIGHCIDEALWILEPPECGLAFKDPAFRQAAAKAIAAFKPDLIIIDPWNSVADGDKARDIKAAFAAIRKLVPSSINNPAILIIAHTRKPRVDERACGRMLLDNVVGSYMLGSVPRSVFVMQHASDRVDEDRVVMTCCKNNNGQLGLRSAWKRNAGGIFDEITDFDWHKFESAGRIDKETWRELPAILSEIGNCCRAALKADLVTRFKISERTADRWINLAGSARIIRFDNHSDTYFVPSQT